VVVRCALVALLHLTVLPELRRAADPAGLDCTGRLLQLVTDCADGLRPTVRAAPRRALVQP
jgi:hypothetical protein